MGLRIDFQLDGKNAHVKASSQVEKEVNEAVWGGEDAGDALLDVLETVLSGDDYDIKRE